MKKPLVYYKKRNRCSFVVSGIPLLLFYGIPALLVLCVLSGAAVLTALIIQTKKERQDTNNKEKKPYEKNDKSDKSNDEEYIDKKERPT